ncbi:MAG TPA: hypothetical protein VGX03_09665, partial [Candidatus Binatia bacterium]|nr:hypothetical protein [Candidatus Binatia bacterium]
GGEEGLARRLYTIAEETVPRLFTTALFRYTPLARKNDGCSLTSQPHTNEKWDFTHEPGTELLAAP